MLLLPAPNVAAVAALDPHVNLSLVWASSKPRRACWRIHRRPGSAAKARDHATDANEERAARQVPAASYRISRFTRLNC